MHQTAAYTALLLHMHVRAHITCENIRCVYLICRNEGKVMLGERNTSAPSCTTQGHKPTNTCMHMYICSRTVCTQRHALIVRSTEKNTSCCSCSQELTYYSKTYTINDSLVIIPKECTKHKLTLLFIMLHMWFIKMSNFTTSTACLHCTLIS